MPWNRDGHNILDALKSWSNVGSPLDFYAPTVFRYAEAPDIYIALVPIFYHWRKSTQRPGLILKRDQSAEGKFQAKRKLSWPDSFDVHLDRLLRGKLMLKDAVVTPEAVAEKDIIQSMGL